MKKLLMGLVLFIAMGTAANAQGGPKKPAPSPGTTIKQDFASSAVELSYSRPGVKGRKIFGELVPFDKVWRTGANAATTITFGENVTVGGKAVPAGKYGLLTIPGQSQWTFIITKQLDVTSPGAYKQDQDVVRFTAKPEEMPFPVENFTLLFDNIKDASMDLFLLWDKTVVFFPITTAK